MPPSPFLQVTTPPDSPPQESPLGNADKDDSQQVLVNATNHMSGKMSAGAQAPPLNIGRLTQALEAIVDPMNRPPRSITAHNVPPNTPLPSHMGAEGHVKEPVGQMVPSPNNPSAYADHAANIPNSELASAAFCKELSNTQTEVAPNSSPTANSAPVTMSQLKELFQAVLEQKSSSAAHTVSGPAAVPKESGEQDEDAKRVRASKLDYKTVDEVYGLIPV